MIVFTAWLKKRPSNTLIACQRHCDEKAKETQLQQAYTYLQEEFLYLHVVEYRAVPPRPLAEPADILPLACITVQRIRVSEQIDKSVLQGQNEYNK